MASVHRAAKSAEQPLQSLSTSVPAERLSLPIAEGGRLLSYRQCLLIQSAPLYLCHGQQHNR